MAVISRMYVQDNRRASQKILIKFHTNLSYGKTLIFQVPLLSIATTLWARFHSIIIVKHSWR